MSLFGRRKPGFSKEVELRPEDITNEFSDKNDPAMNRDANPKEEKAEMAARAQAVMGAAEQTAGQAADGEQKVDLFDYLDSLPEVEDPFPRRRSR